MITPWQKPFRGTQLNKAHPLVRGLIGCWIFNEGAGPQITNLVDGRVAVPDSASEVQWSPGPDGVSADFAGNSLDQSFKINQILFGVSDPWTIVWQDYVHNDPSEAISLGDNSNNYDYIWHSEGNYLRFKDHTNHAFDFTGVTSFYHWQEYAFVTNGGGSANSILKLYVDGLFLEQKTSTYTAFSLTDLGGGYNNAGYILDGQMSRVFVYNRELSAEEIAWLHREPYAMFQQPSRARSLYIPTAVEYSLDCAAGAFTETGQIVALLKSSVVVPTAGSYAESGVAASLLKSSLVGAAAGSYAETGQIAALLKSHLIAIGAASYAETGQVAGLLKSSVVGAGADSYALTGQIVDLLKSSKIDAVGTSYTLTGQVLALLKSGKISIETAAYILTGQTVTLTKAAEIDIEADSYALAGQIVALLKSGRIVPESGVYNLTGLDLDLLYAPGEGVYRPIFRPRRR